MLFAHLWHSVTPTTSHVDALLIPAQTEKMLPERLSSSAQRNVSFLRAGAG
jgi:hypothetical protein